MEMNDQPIAIVGIGCRFPGEASSPQKFWELMANKTDAIVDVPEDRWDLKRFYDKEDSKPTKIRVNQGGFLKEKIKEFDPLFFGISPVEAETLDPQSRILLEAAYEAVEDTGLTLDALKGSKTGVFVGGFTIDNYLTWGCSENAHLINSHTSLGITLTMLSNRLSYFFDLKGPSLTIDTACSSSLVATHYACQSIRSGESEMALVGGVNIMTSPYTFISMSKGQFLSKHGRCKTFDSDAGGYVRAEGGGVVVLKPLEKAIADGDRIYALINGSGVNQDGQTNGITVPSKDSQKALIRKVYAQGGVESKDIDYVEAHGTGTPIGDPIEFGALSEVLAENRDPNNKLFVGSVKSNIGHMEAGAGIAGLIKTTLCLHNNQVPPNLHFNNPNPAINYDNSILKVPTKMEQLPLDKVSYASVNSFGYGGTNAHVLLKQYNEEENKPETTTRKTDSFVFPIATKSKASLKQRAADYRKYIQENGDDFDQVLSNVLHRRSFHSDRLAVYANSKDDLIEKLEAFEEDILVKGVAYGVAPAKKPKIAYVYTGMGPQWWKMGREMMETEPVFREAVEECDRHFIPISGWSIIEEMQKPEETSKIKETNIAQTANFVVQVGLTRLLEHYGMSPDAVVGHSVGEVTSLYISGAMTLDDALMVSYHRSRLQHQTSGKGGMLAVGLGEDELTEILAPYDDVSIASINSTKATTLAGAHDSLAELAEKFESMKVFNRMLEVSVPYHSPVMNLIKDEVFESLKTLKGHETTVDLYSTVTGDKIAGTEINSEYWWQNIRNSVQFAKAFESLSNDGYTVFIEIGPHPVLKNSMMECANYSKEFHFLQTLNRKQPEQLNFYENLSSLFTIGYNLNWDRWVEKGQQLTLPKYPWQRKHYWLESEKSIENKLGRTGESVFLNSKLDTPAPSYKVELNNRFFPFMNDHVVQDQVVFPGAGYIAAAIALHQNELTENGGFGLEHIKFHQLLTVKEDELQYLYTSLKPNTNNFDIQSKIEGEDTSWIKRATGKCIAGSYTDEAGSLDLTSLLGNMNKNMSSEEIYEKLSEANLHYGPYFRGIKNIQHSENQLIAEISGCDDMKGAEGDYFIHPALLDSCFQTLVVFDGDESVPVVPVSIEKIQCYVSPGLDFKCHTKLRSNEGNSIIADITIVNSKGEIAMNVHGIKCQEIASSEFISDEFPDNCLYEVGWEEEQVKVSMEDLNKSQDTTYVIVTNDYESSQTLTNELNGKVVVFLPGEELREIGENAYEVNLADVSSYSDLLKDGENTNLELIYIPETQVSSETLSTETCLEYINPLLNLIRYCSDEFPRNLSLNLITQKGHVVNDEDQELDLTASIFIGLGRLMSNEFPAWKIRLVDFDTETSISADQWKVALDKLKMTRRAFEELAIRGNRLYKKVMLKKPKEEKEQVMKTVAFRDHALELKLKDSSDLNSIRFEESLRAAPSENEVEILIENSSLDKKDYLKIAKRISEEAFEGTNSSKNIGSDCVGIVTRTGSDVKDFKVGDKVLALSKGNLKSFAIVNEKLVQKCPTLLETAASTVISPFLTAFYSLRNKAGLTKGDRLLIHNATDGTGLAAIQYAKLVGAEIFATAKNEEQRTYLESQGIAHVFNANDLAFSTRIASLTNNEGVNVIIGSAEGETMHQSLALLAPYGVYLETGKQNAIKDETLSMKVFSKNLSFISVDIDQLCKDRPELIAELLKDISGLIEVGQLSPIPHVSFKPQEVNLAFEQIENDSLIGRAVIDFKDQVIDIENQESLFKSRPKLYHHRRNKRSGIGNRPLDDSARC